MVFFSSVNNVTYRTLGRASFFSFAVDFTQAGNGGQKIVDVNVELDDAHHVIAIEVQVVSALAERSSARSTTAMVIGSRAGNDRLFTSDRGDTARGI